MRPPSPELLARLFRRLAPDFVSHESRFSAILRRLASGTLWSLLGAIAIGSSGLLTAILVARILGKTGFGELGAVIATFAVFSLIGRLGLGATATRFLAQLREGDRREVGQVAGAVTTTSYASHALVSLALYVAAAPLAESVFHTPSLADPLRITGGLVLANGVDSIHLSLLAGFERFRLIALLKALRGILTVALSPIFALGLGVEGAIIGSALAAAIVAPISYRFARNALAAEGISLWRKVRLATIRRIWRFALPTFLAGALLPPISWFLIVLLTREPSGYEQVAFFSAANQWRGVAILIPNVANSVTLAVQSNLFGQERKNLFHQALVTNLWIQAVLGVAICGAMMLLSPLLMTMYGDGFRQAASILVLLAASWVFVGPTWVLWNSLLAAGRVGWAFLFNLVGAAVLLLTGLTWVSSGASGIALAFLASAVATLALQVVYLIIWRRKAKNEVAAVAS